MNFKQEIRDQWGRECSVTATPDDVRVESRADGKTEIVGYGAVFYRKDDPGTEYELAPGFVERIMPGAFDRALSEGHDTRALYNHNPDNLLGRVQNGTMRLEKNKRGLLYRIPVDDADSDHKRVLAKIQRGDLTGSSFGFVVLEDAWRTDAEAKLEVREIHSVQLWDVGPVTFPAYASTTAAARQSTVDGGWRASYQAWKASQTPGSPETACDPAWSTYYLAYLSALEKTL